MGKSLCNIRLKEFDRFCSNGEIFLIVVKFVNRMEVYRLEVTALLGEGKWEVINNVSIYFFAVVAKRCGCKLEASTIIK